MPDATPVASSATPEQATEPLSAAELAVQAGDQAAYKAAKAAERLGTPLDPTPADQPAETAPAKPVDQAGERPEPSPASEPGKPSGHKGNVETRKQQLDAEIAELQSRLRLRAQLREEVARSESATPPKSAAAAAAQTSDTDPEPQLSTFEADPEKYPDPYLAYTKAVARWEARQEHAAIEAKRREADEAAERTRSLEQRDSAFRERLNAEHATNPAWLDAISEDVKALRPFNALGPGEQPTGYNAIAEEIVRSDRPGDLMRHFSAQPNDLHRIAGLPPRELLREMGKLEARLDAPAPPAPAAPKTLTSAPPPPTTLGTRPADPADPLEAAIKAGDMTAFKAARRRQRAADRKR